MISLAILACRSARVVSSSSSSLSSTSKISFSAMSDSFPLGAPGKSHGPEQPRGLLGRARLCEQISLPLVALVLAEEAGLLLGFHALGEHPHAEHMAERDDGLGDRRIAASLAELGDERPVDLQAVDRQSGEVA